MMRLEGIIGLIPQRHHNPLLTHLLLEAREGRAWVRGGDGSVEAAAPVEGLEVVGEGTVLLPRRLAEYLPRARRMEVSGSEVVLELQGGGVVQGQATPPEGYPEPLGEGEAGEVEAELPEEALEALGDLTRFASKVEYRAIFRGIQLELSEKGVRAVASDGYRLALVDLPGPGGPERRAVLPRWGLEAALRLVRDEARLVLGRGYARLWRGDGRVSLSLMEGEFPDYRRVIPPSTPYTLLVDREGGRAVLEAALPMADPQNRRVDLRYDGHGWALEVEGPYGRGRWPFPARLEGEANLEAGAFWPFEGRHLLDALAFLQTAEVRVGLEAPGAFAPSRWEGAWGGLQGLVVLVPLRV